MKHVAAIGPKQNIVKEIDTVKHNDDQILIHTKYVGVCMSEHYDWATAKPGDAFGHEPSGIIEAIGKNCEGLGYKIGDRVSGMWGSSLPGAGGMVEYAAADPRKDTVIVVPNHLRLEDLILEPLSCLMSAVSKAKVDMPGMKVAVIGCGYMGCGAIGLLKLRGAHVTAVDIRPESVANALKYGADEAYLVNEAEEKFLKNPAFEGFEVVMEWGETDASLDFAVRMTKMLGQLCIGAYHTGGKRMVDVQLLNVRSIEALSVHPRDWDRSIRGAHLATELLANGAWNYLNVPTKVYPRNKFDQAHEELETKYGKYLKAVIDMTWEDGEPYIV